MSEDHAAPHPRLPVGSSFYGKKRHHIVTTDFSAGETRILEELDHLIDAHGRLHRSVEHLLHRANSRLSVPDLSRQNSPGLDCQGHARTVAAIGGAQAKRLAVDFAEPSDCTESEPPMTSPPHYSSSGRDAILEEAERSIPICHPFASSSASCEHRNIQAVLGTTWPTNLKQRGLQTDQTSAHSIGAKKIVTAHSSRTGDSETGEVRSGCRNWLAQRVVIDPNSRLRISFDVLSVFVLVWDLTIIPFRLAWDIDPEGLWLMVAWFTVCFWTADILLNCCTALFDGGKIVRDPMAIFQHYYRTWLVPDCIVAALDWFTVIVMVILDSQSGASLKMLRIAKMGKAVRIVGMLKLLKIARIAEVFLSRSSFEAYRMTMKIVAALVAILWITHILTCGWFLIGRLDLTDTGLRWFDSSGAITYLDQSSTFQYLGAFHWAFAQITLGATEVLATNSIEKTYTVLCMLFGLLFGSTLVSSLSATMVEFQMLRNGREQKLRTLRHYLSDNGVDLNLSFLVQKQVKERLGPTDRLSEKDVPVLGLLSAHLGAELKAEIYRRDLVTHPLFRNWAGMDKKLFVKLCTELEFSFLRADDHLFDPVEAEQQFYYLIKGDLTYTQTRESAFGIASPETSHVPDRKWLAEAAMWSYWRHVGTAEAQHTCQILTVSMPVVAAVLNTHHIIRKVITQYAEIFHKRLRNARPPTYPYPTDLQVPLCTFADIVVSMDQDCQLAISTEALKEVARPTTRNFYDLANRYKIQRLEAEVRRGASATIIDENGELVRVVHVVSVRLENAEGHVLMQVATYNDTTGLAAECCLPEVKIQDGEDSREAANRCLTEKVPAIDGEVEFFSITHLSEHQDTKLHAVRTNYLKTVFTGQLQQLEELKRFRWESASMRGLQPILSNAASGLKLSADWREIFAMCSPNDEKTLFYCWCKPDVALNGLGNGVDVGASPSLQKQLSALAISSQEIRDLRDMQSQVAEQRRSPAPIAEATVAETSPEEMEEMLQMEF